MINDLSERDESRVPGNDKVEPLKEIIKLFSSDSAVEPLLEEVFSLCAGDNLELCRLAGELLLAESSEYISRQRWLTLRLASLAGGEDALEKRMPLITAMAGLNEKQQAFHIEHCRDRDEIARELSRKRKWPELLSLLSSSLLRWQPELESTAELVWLTKTFSELKKECQGSQAELCLKMPGGALFQADSSSYMEILVEETVTAAAAAWQRCLRGPGGVNFGLANLWVFADQELGAEILDLLARDPVAYVSLVKEAAEDRAKEGLENILVLKYLLQGVHAAEYCLTNLLRECLSTAARDVQSLNELKSALKPIEKRLQPFLKGLAEEFLP